MQFLAVTEREELEELAALADEIWHECFPGILSAGQIDYMVEKFQSEHAVREQMRTQGYRYYLLRESGRTAGYLGVAPADGKLFLSKLYLRREYRGRGLASQAFAFAEDLCGRCGLSAVRLTVNRGNTHAIAVYRKWGFATVCEQAADIGCGYVMDDYVLEKPVQPRENRVLIVVDMQNDFVTGALGSQRAQAIVAQIGARLEQARAQGEQVIFTLDTHGADYLRTAEGKKLPVPHCLRGSRGHAVVPGLQTDGAVLYCKGAFGSPALAQDLAAQNATAVELVGVCTDICVISNAMLLKAFAPECRVAVNAALCAGVTPESHERALEAMRSCQIDVI